ncbi:hypothetical protein LJB42_002316 [Komagataella kurtzmanii]|nr:hypothetical protein LJB42_002316 [Komagataella kurtzmanii]
MEFKQSDFEHLVELPSEIDNGEVLYSPVGDASMLSCGCVISENLFTSLKGLCAVCYAKDIHLVGPVYQLRELYHLLMSQNAFSTEYVKSGQINLSKQDNLDTKNNKGIPILDAFHQILVGASKETQAFQEKSNQGTVFPKNDPQDIAKLDSDLLHISKSAQLGVSTSTTHSNPELELNFARNFPFFKRQYHFITQKTKMLLKTSKIFINNAISPALNQFVLLNETKFQVYSIDPIDYSSSPKMKCCGKSTGEFGLSFDSLNKPVVRDKELISKLNKWEYLACRITKNMLIISGTRGILEIYDTNDNGKCIYTYQSKFPIRCIDVSNNESLIAIGITGKDKFTQSEQTLITFLRLDFLENEIKVDVITVTLPYKDPLNLLQFSPDSQYLGCATALEFRFMVISVIDPHEPKLVMKSLRSLDSSLESEGITDMQFFPDNRTLTLTSVAFNGSPVVIDSKLNSIVGLQAIAQPTMLLKVDEVGSAIHKACISPRGDAVAYLDRSGSCYLLLSPIMDGNEHKRVVIVAEVANAVRFKEAASMRFDSDGYKLYILDRKGSLYIEDFTASSDLTRCKLIS